MPMSSTAVHTPGHSQEGHLGTFDILKSDGDQRSCNNGQPGKKDRSGVRFVIIIRCRAWLIYDSRRMLPVKGAGNCR